MLSNLPASPFLGNFESGLQIPDQAIQCFHKKRNMDLSERKTLLRNISQFSVLITSDNICTVASNDRLETGILCQHLGSLSKIVRTGSLNRLKVPGLGVVYIKKPTSLGYQKNPC